MDDTKLLKDISIAKRVYVLKTFLYDVTLVNESTAIGLVHNGNRVAKFDLSDNQVFMRIFMEHLDLEQTEYKVL